MITPELLAYILGKPRPNQSLIVAAEKLQWAAEKFGIDTPLRVAHWLGQLAQESKFEPIQENLRYTTPARLVQVFPSKFKTAAQAAPYCNNPEKLANLCYGTKLGNLGVESGDGWRFHGRGMIQLTGRDNYALYGKLIGYNLLVNPDLLLQYGISALVAGAYWQNKNINVFADRDDVGSVTALVNGVARRELSERKAYVDRAKKYLGL